MFKRTLIPHAGFYTLREIRFLRGIVREAQLLCDQPPDEPGARRIARAVFDALSRGEEDRATLLLIGVEHCRDHGKRRYAMPPIAQRLNESRITWHRNAALEKKSAAVIGNRLRIPLKSSSR